MCKVILNSCIKCWTIRRQTGLLGAKPNPASPNCHVRSVLFWDITQRRVVILHWYFRTTYQYSFKGQEFLWYCQLVLSGSIECKKADLEWLKRKWLWSMSRYYACNLLGVLSKIIHVNPRKVSVVAKFQCMHLPNWSLLHHHFSHIVQ
jgi:hypothetical protein